MKGNVQQISKVWYNKNNAEPLSWNASYLGVVNNLLRELRCFSGNNVGCKSIMLLCVIRHLPAWLPLYKAPFPFISPLGPQQTSAVRSLFIGVLLLATAPILVPLGVTTSRALLGRGVSMSFPWADSLALRIHLEASDPWRIVQSRTDLWYWDLLVCACARQIGVLK